MMFLDDAISHAAGTSPGSIAVSHLGRTVTYEALDRAANSFADELLGFGVGRGDRVVISAKKGPTTIAALYAVLRVGAIYVPIDISAPDARRASIIENVQAKVAVVDPALEDAFEGLGVCRLADLRPSDRSAAVSERMEKRQSTDGAYILHTSGSTGTPKGILHTHKSGLAYAKMAAALTGLTATDRVSHHTPIHFDMSIFDIFSASVAGATCIVIPEMHAMMPASLTQLTEAEAITVWYSVPFALRQMVERGVLADRDLSALRLVMFAGEKMPPAILRDFVAHVPTARILNAYGPTETNHCVTADLAPSDFTGEAALPIGLPDTGSTAHIGEGGELLIAGDQVMVGYWNDEGRNAQVFVEIGGRRFYRTGDLVRRDEAGRLHLLGRKDRQIKLRGYRIELDEIELALTNAPGVSEAVVSVENEGLSAFVTGPGAIDLAEVSQSISSVLPRYAVPDTITVVDDFARTATGKVDRLALLARKGGQDAA